MQVDRKLVKQTVMTSVYGVTYIGARDQIKKRLKERATLPDEQVFGASCYAARVRTQVKSPFTHIFYADNSYFLDNSFGMCC